MTTVPLFFLVTIFGVAISATMIVWIFSQTWLRRHRKITDTEEKAEKMLESARQESLAIIKSAHEQARKLISDSNEISSQITDITHLTIQDSVKEKSKELEETLSELQQQFAASLSGIQSQYINTYKKAIKDIESDAGKQVEKMREFFESETSSSSTSLQSMTKQGLKIVQSNLEDYERDQKAKVDTIIYGLLKDVTEEVLGKSLPLDAHQNLISKAIEEAKKQSAFN